MKKLVKVLAVTAFGLTAAGASHAATSQATFQVTANVSAACSVTANDLAFGAYSATALVPTDNSSTITVTCTNGTGYGVDVGPTPTVRTLAGPGGNLNFGMYNDSNRTVGFGVTGATGTGVGQDYTVYGRIPVGQFVQTGAYTATVTVTVTY